MSDLMNLISLPTYTVKIPSTNKPIHFRPFVVKEEKILLIAQESKDPNQIYAAIKNIFQSCIKEKIDFETLTYFDIEYIFIQLRMKSMGEIVEIIVKDPETKERFETQMNLEKIEIKNIKNKKDFTIKLSDDIAVTMKYPNLNIMNSIKLDSNENISDGVIMMICNSIDTIFTKNEAINVKEKTQEEIIQFVENLPKSMFDKITSFFDKLPYIVYEDEFITPKGKKIPIVIRDFNNFFR
jgi:hypothetical protein